MRDWRSRLVSGVLFPLQEKLKRHTTLDLRDSLEQTQWWASPQLAALQEQRLRALLIDAGRNVPYYAQQFRDRGFDPSAASGIESLRQLPFLTKSSIRSHLEALKHREPRGLTRLNTGGSSGEPLIFFVGRERVSHDVAAKWRATRWWGVDIGDPEIVVWGSPIELGAQDRLRRWRDLLLRTQLLPAFQMSEDKLDDFVAAIRRRRPKMLFGYPSALAHIGAHARKRGIAMDDLGIRVAFVTSERLYDAQRQAIEQVFGCRVANGYGGRDAGFIAHECPEGRMHVTAEDIVVELVGQDGMPVPPGQPGEVVTTHLATRDFPFIRYRTGDVAVMDPAPCPCGRGLPVIKEVQGRTTDFVVAADGTVMHGLALIYVLRDLPGIDSFKVVQESLDRTTVFLVVNAAFDRAARDAIVAGFRQRLGPSVHVEIEVVPQIAPERSGKFRYVVSRAVETH
jgi:phenylacetate-CoA ligase